MPVPKVNVLIVTYNHEQFIGQALESVLAQQVDFPYTVVVGEDCSTDQTRAIVEQYRQRYPERIKPLYHSHNVGPGANLKACLAACQGTYIAALDGDDYWTDPHKLAKQVAWLDANPDFSLCFHHVEVLKQGELEVQIIPPLTTQLVYTLTDLLGTTMPPTGSVVLRNCLPALPDWLFETYPIDVPLFALYAEVGKIKLLPEVMGCYRHHAGGTWTAQSVERNQQRLYAMFQRLIQHYASTPYNHPVKRTISRLQLTRADEHLKQGRTDAAFLVLQQAARLWPSYTPALTKSLLGVTLRWLKSKTATGGPSIG
jgi:glycosyltransferase involved in cell wall biosynthesis